MEDDMSKALSITEDKSWMHESDARTLAEADLIRKDAKRHGNAVAAAKRMSEDRMQEAKSMKAVASRKIKKEAVKSVKAIRKPISKKAR
jgi:hypothetical protein